MLLAWIIYAALGLVAGVLAGLLGVGGGIVIVPMLSIAFELQGLPSQYLQHMALGTSLGTIMFTSISSFRAHHKHGAVNWSVVRRITLGILVGTLAGSWLAAQLSTRFLKGFFAVFLFYVATQMLLNFKPKAGRQLPGTAGMSGVGGVSGVVASLLGIGGGTLSVPFMVWCNMTMHNAVGTSAAIGFPIAVAGAAGYLFNGLHVSGLPPMSLGFLYIPALVGIAATSILTAPLGARIAHKLPVAQLKRVFAVLLYVMGARMVWTMF
ncbi:sulfite exporter TauE/SafE family protein [Desulfovibrio sp.]